jgi:hypothetical protein
MAISSARTSRLERLMHTEYAFADEEDRLYLVRQEIHTTQSFVSSALLKSITSYVATDMQT